MYNTFPNPPKEIYMWNIDTPLLLLIHYLQDMAPYIMKLAYQVHNRRSLGHPTVAWQRCMRQGQSTTTTNADTHCTQCLPGVLSVNEAIMLKHLLKLCQSTMLHTHLLDALVEVLSMTLQQPHKIAEKAPSNSNTCPQQSMCTVSNSYAHGLCPPQVHEGMVLRMYNVVCNRNRSS